MTKRTIPAVVPALVPAATTPATTTTAAAAPALSATSDTDRAARPALLKDDFIACNKVMFIVSDSYAYDAIFKQAAEAAKGPEDIIFHEESIAYNVRTQASSLAIDSVDVVGRMSSYLMTAVEKMYDKYNADEIVIVIPFIKNYWLIPFVMTSLVDKVMATDWGKKLVEDEELCFYGLDVPGKMLVPFSTNMQPYEISLRLVQADLEADKAADAMVNKFSGSSQVSAFEERMAKAATPPEAPAVTKTAVQSEGGVYSWSRSSHLD